MLRNTNVAYRSIKNHYNGAAIVNTIAYTDFGTHYVGILY